MEKNNMTAVEWLVKNLEESGIPLMKDELEMIQQAKEMEREQHNKWNEFLDAEKVLGISDVKTIERIQWYYNKYYNETYGQQQ